MFSNQRGAELLERFSKLRNDFRSDQLLDRLLLFRFGKNVYLKLDRCQSCVVMSPAQRSATGTYHILLGLCVVGTLGDPDAAANVGTFFCFACPT